MKNFVLPPMHNPFLFFVAFDLKSFSCPPLEMSFFTDGEIFLNKNPQDCQKVGTEMKRLQKTSLQPDGKCGISTLPVARVFGAAE